jgi:hypothetical protein
MIKMKEGLLNECGPCVHAGKICLSHSKFDVDPLRAAASANSVRIPDRTAIEHAPKRQRNVSLCPPLIFITLNCFP